MLLHPSSISSFRKWLPAYLEVPLLGSLAVTGMVFAAAELAARRACRPYEQLWAYWSPEAGANLAAFQAHMAKHKRLSILICGDSTAQSNFHPEAFTSAGLTFDALWNIGTPGAFVEAFGWTIWPLVEQTHGRPEVLVVSFLPSAFGDSPAIRHLEERILTSPAGRMARGKFHLGAYLALARVWPTLRVWKAEREGKLAAIVQKHGFQLRERTVDLAHEPPAISQDGPLQEERLRVLERLAAWAQDHGVELVIVLPPQLAHNASSKRAEDEYRKYLLQLQRRVRFVLFDASHLRWSADQFADRSHLNDRGARCLSSLLVTNLAQSDSKTHVHGAPVSHLWGESAAKALMPISEQPNAHLGNDGAPSVPPRDRS